MIGGPYGARVLTRGVVGGMLVLTGGMVVSTIPESTWVMQLGWLLDLRGSVVGRMVALSVVVIGLGLQAAAWLSLCRRVSRATGEARVEAAGLVQRACCLWSAPLLLAPPLFSRDGWSYAAQGVLLHYDLSPYVHGPGILHGPIVEGVDPQWWWTPAPYGPLPLMAGELASGITENPWLLVFAHRLLALAGLAMLAWAVPRLAGWTGADPVLASAVVTCSPLVIAHGVGGLHNDLLMVGLMAVALVLAVEHGWVAGAAAGGLAAGVKMPGGLVCIAVALVALPAGARVADRLRRLLQVGSVSVVAMVVPGLLAGLGVGWVTALGVPAMIETPLSATTVLGSALDNLTDWVGADLPYDAWRRGLRGAGSLLALAVAAVIALRSRTGDRAAAVRVTAVVTCAVVLLSPVVHLWYLLWAVPFVAAMRLSRGVMAALLSVCAISGLVAPMDSSLHGAYLAIVSGSLTVAAVVLLVLLTRRARDRMRAIVGPTSRPDPDVIGPAAPVP